MNPYQLWILITTALVFIAYLNLCTSYDEFETPRIWPNISDNHSFLQWPGLTGSGGLDFNIYDAFAAATNKTRLLPNFIAQFGNYTLLQVWLMIVVGAGAASVGTLLAEAFLFKAHDDYISKQQHQAYGPPHAPAYGIPSDSYGAPAPPPPPVYSAPPPAPAYSAPPPAPSYSAPSSTYGAPPPAPAYSASPPVPTYSAPPSSYAAPPPVPSYSAPAPAPSIVYGSPPPSPPAPTYSAPAPSSVYGSPPPFDSYSQSSQPSPSYESPLSRSNIPESPVYLLSNKNKVLRKRKQGQ